MEVKDLADDPLLDRRELQRRFPTLPTSQRHLLRLEEKGFPPAIWVTARRRAWRLSGVLAYIKQREQEAIERQQRRMAKAGA